MKKTHSNISSILKKKLISITIFIALAIFFLSSLVYYSNKDKNNSILVNSFGKQRMRSQMIAKDVNRKYVILMSLKYGTLVNNPQTLRERLVTINNSILTTRSQYNDMLKSLHSGILQSDGKTIKFVNAQNSIKPALTELDKLWLTFDKSIVLIAKSSSIDKSTAEALAFINMNNEKLMQLSDNINQAIMEIQIKNSNRVLVISVFFMLFIIILVLIFIYEFLRYLVLPLNEIYKGISSLGLFEVNKTNTPTKKEIVPIVNEIYDGMGKLSKMMELIAHINKDISFEETLEYIYNSFSAFIPYNHIGIALLKEDGITLEATYGMSDNHLGGLSQKMVGLSSVIGETSLMSIITSGNPRIINNLSEFTKNHSAKYNKLLLESGIRSSISLPLKRNDELLGIIFFSSTEPNTYSEEHVLFLLSIADSIAISFSKNIFIDELIYSNVLALAKMAESRDEDTGEHLDRMKMYSKLITELLSEEHVYEDEITIRFIKDIERYSPMHDIGKVGVRDGILLKPGKLTEEEFEEMKKHALYGAEVLKTEEMNINKKDRSLFVVGIEIAEGHHEKWNGSGYPYGRKGEEIPLSARIVAIADVFDALTSRRPYKKAFPFDESFKMILEGSGTHFDPNIVAVFEKNRSKIFALYSSFQNMVISA